jgi:voltage-gated potassium channel Kch
VGEAFAKRLEAREPASADLPRAEPAGDRAVILGFGRVGRLVGEMLAMHDAPYIAIDPIPGCPRSAPRGLPVLFGNVASETVIDRLDLDHARALIVTMDEPVLVSRIVKKLHKLRPELPIIVRARDAVHAGELYRAGATHAVPETLESSLQLSEAVLVDLGVPMGPVIASIHEKRDELRQQIMEDGDLAIAPAEVDQPCANEPPEPDQATGAAGIPTSPSAGSAVPAPARPAANCPCRSAPATIPLSTRCPAPRRVSRPHARFARKAGAEREFARIVVMPAQHHQRVDAARGVAIRR